MSICVLLTAVGTSWICVQERSPFPCSFPSQTCTHATRERGRRSACSRVNDHCWDCYLFFMVTNAFMEMFLPPNGHKAWDHLCLLPSRVMAAEMYPDMWMERIRERSAPVLLIDGLVYAISAFTRVALDFEESSQTALLARGICYWVRSHLIAWTQYPSVLNTHCIAHQLEWLSQKL